MRGDQRRGHRGNASRDADDGHRLSSQIDIQLGRGLEDVLQGRVGGQTVSGGDGDRTLFGDDRPTAADDARHRSQTDDPRPPIDGLADGLVHVSQGSIRILEDGHCPHRDLVEPAVGRGARGADEIGQLIDNAHFRDVRLVRAGEHLLHDFVQRTGEPQGIGAPQLPEHAPLIQLDERFGSVSDWMNQKGKSHRCQSVRVSGRPPVSSSDVNSTGAGAVSRSAGPDEL